MAGWSFENRLNDFIDGEPIAKAAARLGVEGWMLTLWPFALPDSALEIIANSTETPVDKVRAEFYDFSHGMKDRYYRAFIKAIVAIDEVSPSVRPITDEIPGFMTSMVRRQRNISKRLIAVEEGLAVIVEALIHRAPAADEPSALKERLTTALEALRSAPPELSEEETRLLIPPLGEYPVQPK